MDPSDIDQLFPRDTGPDQPQPRARIFRVKRPPTVAEARANTPAEQIESEYCRFWISARFGLIPERQIAELLQPTALKIDYRALARFLWQEAWDRGEPLPYSGRELIQELRKIARAWQRYNRLEADKEMQLMHSFLDKIPSLCARFPLLNDLPGAEGSRVDVTELFAEALNLVRFAASGILVKWHGEGIRDADANRLEEHLLALGKAIQHDAGPETASGAELVSDLLAALNAYDPDAIEAEFRLLRAGCRLLIGMAGPESYFGLFAQLDLYAVLDRLMTRDEFIGIMDRLAEQVSPLAASRECRDLVARLNEHRPDPEKLPTATRLRSYALGNLTLAALDTALAADTSRAKRESLLVQAREAATEVARRDGGFECWRWYQLGIAACTAQLLEDDRELRETLARFGESDSLAIAAAIDKHFDRPNLVALLGRVLPAYLSAKSEKPS